MGDSRFLAAAGRWEPGNIFQKLEKVQGALEMCQKALNDFMAPGMASGWKAMAFKGAEVFFVVGHVFWGNVQLCPAMSKSGCWKFGNSSLRFVFSR